MRKDWIMAQTRDTKRAWSWLDRLWYTQMVSMMFHYLIPSTTLIFNERKISWMTISPLLILYSRCETCHQVSISIKLFEPFWLVKGVIFGEYFVTFTSHLSLIFRWQRPRQDTHRSCWTLSSSCTARYPQRTWTTSSSSLAWWRSRISLLEIHFQKWKRTTMHTRWLHSLIFTWHEYLSICSHWKCNHP